MVHLCKVVIPLDNITVEPDKPPLKLSDVPTLGEIGIGAPDCIDVEVSTEQDILDFRIKALKKKEMLETEGLVIS